MIIEHNDFIGVYKNVYPDGYCRHLIDQFEMLESKGVGSNRQDGEGALKHDKDDYAVFLGLRNQEAEPFVMPDGESLNIIAMFFDGLQVCYDDYSSKYSVLKTQGSIRGSSFKMQRTSPGGGYHIWHGEQGGANPHRVLAYMLYLNTVPIEEAGETEFLYQKTRINPVENTMIIWPAAFTHAHRGNPVLGDNYKYIVTGWFSFD